MALSWAGREAAGGQFLHAFLWRPVPPEMTVPIDIKPDSSMNTVNPQSEGRLSVAILSTPNFDAFAQVERPSLRFGRTGEETSLAFCSPNAVDVNGDLRDDLVCHFATQLAGFVPGDTMGMLRGATGDGQAFGGSDSIHLVPNRN